MPEIQLHGKRLFTEQIVIEQEMPRLEPFDPDQPLVVAEYDPKFDVFKEDLKALLTKWQGVVTATIVQRSEFQ